MKKQIAKTAVFSICMLLIFILLTAFSFKSPTNTLIEQLNNQNAINKINEYVLQNNFEEAFKYLQILENTSGYETLANLNTFKKCLNKYKILMLNNAEQHIKNNDHQSAFNLLSNNAKFFTQDETVKNLLNITQNSIKENDCILFTDNVEVLNFKNILSFPDDALDVKNENYESFHNHHLTPNEFEKVLKILYENNYILVSLSSVVDNINTNKTLSLPLPENKKPVVFLYEHSTDTDNMQGLSDKLILDRSKKLASYTSKKSINNRVNYENDFVTILENFISLNPSFSHKQARATIVSNAQESILGYKILTNNIVFKKELKKARAITTKLKNLNYEFASNGYIDKNIFSLSDVDFTKQLTRFKKEISGQIQHPTTWQINTDISNLQNPNNNYKVSYLLENGYNVFLCNKALNNTNLPNNFNINSFDSKTYVTVNYKTVSVSNLIKNKSEFENLITLQQIYDLSNRKAPLTN